MHRVDLGEVLDRREDVRQPAVDIGHRLAVRGDDARGVGAGGLDRHLLAQHHTKGEFVLIDGPRDALPGRLRDQGAQVRVGAKRVNDGFGVGVEVQQAAAAGDRRGEVAEVVQHELAPHVVGFRCETDDSAASG